MLCTVEYHSLFPQAKDKVSVTAEEAQALRITRPDFEHALEYDIKPAFGISDKQLENYVLNGGLVLYCVAQCTYGHTSSVATHTHYTYMCFV